MSHFPHELSGGEQQRVAIARALASGNPTFSSGGLTRLVGRLEQRGLVRRRRDPADARGSLAALTADGEDRLRQARITHDTVIDEILGAQLREGRLATFARTLDQLASARSSVE